MADSIRGLKNLCTPAYVYLVISLISIVVIAIQNAGNVDKYCLGYLSCNVPNTTMVFLIKILYVLFWTWVLNLICDAGIPSLSWFLVVFPIVLSFVLIAFMMMDPVSSNSMGNVV